MPGGEIPIGVFHKALAEAPCQGVLRGKIYHHHTGIAALGDTASDLDVSGGVVALHPVGFDAVAGVAHGF